MAAPSRCLPQKRTASDRPGKLQPTSSGLSRALEGVELIQVFPHTAKSLGQNSAVPLVLQEQVGGGDCPREAGYGQTSFFQVEC